MIIDSGPARTHSIEGDFGGQETEVILFLDSDKQEESVRVKDKQKLGWGFRPSEKRVKGTDRVPRDWDHRIITMESLILAQDER